MSELTTTSLPYRLGMIGRKIGMTRIFTDEGESIPVTVVDVSNNRIAQIKSHLVDGYTAIQVAYGSRRVSRLSKSQIGHYAKAGIEAGSSLREFHLNDEMLQLKNFSVGSVIAIDSLFKAGQHVDVTGTTIGKGFAGSIKRHNFGAQRNSHGNSRSHRAPGSIGQAQDPGRVFPGKKMPGHMGAVTRTVQNLQIVRIDLERSLLLLKGAVPGYSDSDVIVRPAIKKIIKERGQE
ncbi:large subunit ribosomal protein L3 [Candidatus Kinetoplastibacterium desouzaii TCC079E]|uniref:Large ribosomal subunit protein uL3 n=1 Tax=Candidatus Kinetoplastidibacterium desouzai TCC079E TaxID=1208919 RepID=M1L3H9_9PROT|nr:large subunit ribosomal protein L3 [Candidatus Kinetoplastibacterium desouzaii TCC079E]